MPSGSTPVSDPALPVSFTNFIALRAPVSVLYCILQHRWYHDRFFCAESYILAKSTKLSPLELLFWLKYAPNRLSAGASPQTPPGSLERSPDTIVAFSGPTSKDRKVEEGKGKVGEGRDRRERKEREKEEMDGKRGKGEKGSSTRPLFRCFRRLCILN